MSLIFLAYRRGDTRWITGRIFDRLEAYFGKSLVFMDVETIPPGLDFRKHIENILAQCAVLVAVVGPHWSGPTGRSQPRIFDVDDMVRIEIETALKKHIPIMPVCVDGSVLPTASDLPKSLWPFIDLQTADVDSGRNFNVDIKHLIRAIVRHMGWRHLGWRALVPRSALVAFLVAFSLLLIWFFAVPSFQQTGPEFDRTYAAVQACNTELGLRCMQEGGVFGASEALHHLTGCKDADIVRSDQASLQWKDIWTTSVYSFAPGGGGPGGGLDDDVLKVGGWGDWYFSLIQFNLPPLQRRPQFAAVALCSKKSEGASVPLALDRIIRRWDFPKGDRLWWKDRPGHRAVTTDSLPATRKEQWYIIELTELVQEWLDGKSENFGIQIRPVHDFGSFVFFVSSDATDKNKIPRLIFCS